MYDAEGTKLPELPRADPTNVGRVHPALAGAFRDRHRLYDEFKSKGVPADSTYLCALYDGRALLRTSAQLAKIKRRVVKGQVVDPAERATLDILSPSVIRRLDEDEAHSKQVCRDVALFGDRARAFYGILPVGAYRMRRSVPGRRGGRRPSSRRRTSRTSRSTDSSGDTGPGDGEREAHGAPAPFLLAGSDRLTCSESDASPSAGVLR